MPDDLPVLYAARLPGGAWLVDASEALVTAQGAGVEVVRLDVGALVSVARAAQRYADMDCLDCDYIGGWPDVCPGVGRVGGPCHWCELRAALAALGDSALLGKGE